MAEHNNQASGLFSIFFVSLYTLFLIVYTCYHFCAGEEQTTQPVAKSRKKQRAGDVIKSYLTKRNLILLALWGVWLASLVYTSYATGDASVFDPFEILGVARDATDKEIKKAYRKLSLQYHPDKNPDPKAASYFAEKISKAYAALTDEVSRQNYEKYGHPDGPQAMNLGVALPEWMFSRDSKMAPIMLLSLIGCGILLPLSLISWYILSSNKYSGPNRIMNETIVFFLHSKFSVKESQALVRIPETLMCAMEFITLYTPAEHTQPMEELRKVVAPLYPELMARDKKAFWQRKASVVKAHMLLLAHLERLGDEIPAALVPDYKYVLSKTPLLLEEIIKIALIPRTNANTGWMTPSVAAVEMMQCVAQAVSLSARKPQGKSGENVAPLLQLPHFDSETLKRLKKKRVNTLKDLQDLPEPDRLAVLAAAGLSGVQAEEALTFLAALPQLAVAATCEVEGEDEMVEGDPTHCKVRVMLRRPAHAQEGYRLSGQAVRALTPHNPCPREEGWWFFLVDVASNAVIASTKANLMEAEKIALAQPERFEGLEAEAAARALPAPAAAPADSMDVALANGGAGAGEEELAELPGQVVDLMFLAPPAGRHDLQLLVMSDCWIGADRCLTVRLRVQPLTRAAAEGRDAKSKELLKKWQENEEDGSTASDEGSEAGSGSEGEEGEDYDSEETGEEESGGEDEDSNEQEGKKTR